MATDDTQSSGTHGCLGCRARTPGGKSIEVTGKDGECAVSLAITVKKSVNGACRLVSEEGMIFCTTGKMCHFEHEMVATLSGTGCQEYEIREENEYSGSRFTSDKE